MNRARFLSMLGGVAVAPLGVAAGVTMEAPRQPQVGYIHVDNVGSDAIDYVSLDGRKVAGVFELDDVEGWLRRYTEPCDGFRIVRETGVVEVHWKTA